MQQKTISDHAGVGIGIYLDCGMKKKQLIFYKNAKGKNYVLSFQQSHH